MNIGKNLALDEFVQKLPNLPKTERDARILDEFLRRAMTEDFSAIEVFLDAIARLGRKWERQLVHLLSNFITEHSDHPLADPIQQFISNLKQATIVIRHKETGSNLDDMASLLARLEQLPRDPKPILNVRFDTQDAYVYGLCAIAAWSSAHASAINFESTYPRVSYFLERAGVVEGLRDPSSEPVRFDTETILGFTRIDPSKVFDTDGHAGRLVGLFRSNMDLRPDTAQALAISFAELIENAIKHGGITSPAWLFANYHPQPQIMHVCICDRGMGVQRTFENSSNERLRGIASESLNWLREATEPLVTSKSEGHAGYGLYLARELCRRNAGLFAIVSGRAAYCLHARTPSAEFSDVEELKELSTAWRGTLVALQFRLDRPLDVGPIYESLPTPFDDDQPVEDVDLFDE